MELASPSHKWIYLGAGLLLAVALLMRLTQLNTIPGFSGDEALVGNLIYDILDGKKVSWDVPTGKKISPIFVAMGLPFFIALPPTIITLRLPSLFWSLVLLSVAIYFLPKIMPLPLAYSAALLIACAPMQLVYSRLYIEQGLMGITAILSLCFALQGRWLLLLITHAAALVVHPVNVFLTPMLLFAFGYHLWFESALSLEKKRRLWKAFKIFCLIGVVAIAVYVPQYIIPDNIVRAISDPAFFLHYTYLFIAIVSGVTVIEDFAGPLPAVWATLANITVGILLVGGVGAGVWALKKKKDTRTMALVVGWLLSLALFYAIGGLMGVRPGLQRYTLFILPPTYICLVLLWGAILGAKNKDRNEWVLAGSSLLACGFLFLFAQGFVSEFGHSGGRSHVIYQTSSEEPKWTAYEWILTQQKAQQKASPAHIVAEDFWLFQPLSYFSKKNSGWSVHNLQDKPMEVDWIRAQLAKGGYFAGWVGRDLERSIRESFQEKELDVFSIPNQAGNPLIRVIKLKEKG